MSEPEQKRSPAEVKEIIDGTTSKVRKLMLSELECFDPKNRWLAYGRIVNMLLASHYQVTLGRAEKRLAEVEQEK